MQLPVVALSVLNLERVWNIRKRTRTPIKMKRIKCCLVDIRTSFVDSEAVSEVRKRLDRSKRNTKKDIEEIKFLRI